MGKFLNKFKRKVGEVDSFANKRYNKNRSLNKKRFRSDPYKEKVDFSTEKEESVQYDEQLSEENVQYDEQYNPYDDEVGIQPAQKPESFHHFILENQYKDLERSIRGLKDVWIKKEQKWITVRKERHCFTDEESEMILRMAQSHLATDIKLGRINKEVFGQLIMALYEDIMFFFESIAEYRYGRYGDAELQYQMKLQNHKIFVELFSRIQANYSRAIGGQENRDTHGSVKGQESLQSGERDYTGQRGIA